MLIKSFYVTISPAYTEITIIATFGAARFCALFFFFISFSIRFLRYVICFIKWDKLQIQIAPQISSSVHVIFNRFMNKNRIEGA